MIRLSQIRMQPGHGEQELEEKLRKLLHLKIEDSMEYRIFKQSIDARKKPDIYYTYTIDVKIKQESAVLKRLGQKKQQKSVKAEKMVETVYQVPSHGSERLAHRPVIIGAGLPVCSAPGFWPVRDIVRCYWNVGHR